jgi:hypothetical protein
MAPAPLPERSRLSGPASLLQRDWLAERDRQAGRGWQPRRDGPHHRSRSFEYGITADSLDDARRAFMLWRRSRPFWGGLLVTGGAGEILASEHGPLQLVIHIGIQGLAGYLIPVMLLLCGVLLWFSPAQRAFYSLLAIVLALGSWVTSNLGGFFIGMLLGLVGGALAFAWTIDTDPPLRWFRGDPQVLHPSFGLEPVLRPTAVWTPASAYPSAPPAEFVPYAAEILPYAAEIMTYTAEIVTYTAEIVPYVTDSSADEPGV